MGRKLLFRLRYGKIFRAGSNGWKYDYSWKSTWRRRKPIYRIPYGAVFIGDDWSVNVPREMVIQYTLRAGFYLFPRKK